MKTAEKTGALQRANLNPLCLSLSLMAALAGPTASAAVLAVDLGTASGFAVLAGSGITVAGAISSSTIHGDIGTFPTTSITGSGNLLLTGVNHGGDAVTQQAKDDLIIAYNDAAGRPNDATYADGYVLMGTLSTGVYDGIGSFAITGNLTLDAQGDSDAVWIFKTGSTLITGSNSSITLTGGAIASNIFWQVGSSATLGTNSNFAGTLVTMSSITMNNGATVQGRALALNGAVTMDNNAIMVPEPSGALLVVAGMVGLFACKRRTISRI